MCCFSPVHVKVSFLGRIFGGPKVEHVHVASTRIFARMSGQGASAMQTLAYSMQLTVNGSVAMILPLPVVPGSGDHALKFVSLEQHPKFFDDLEDLFPAMLSLDGGFGPSRLAPQAKTMLVVHNVGAFEASFVPTMRDFDRLDLRFRISDDVWKKIGRYDDYGFAVFRLKPGKDQKIHPMAFSFRTRDASRLFFPTVHVHDGEVHPTAVFSHTLFYQADTPAKDDARSMSAPHGTYEGVCDHAQLVYKRSLYGSHPNEDTFISLDAGA